MDGDGLSYWSRLTREHHVQVGFEGWSRKRYIKPHGACPNPPSISSKHSSTHIHTYIQSSPRTNPLVHLYTIHTTNAHRQNEDHHHPPHHAPRGHHHGDAGAPAATMRHLQPALGREPLRHHHVVHQHRVAVPLRLPRRLQGVRPQQGHLQAVPAQHAELWVLGVHPREHRVQYPVR